MAYLLTNGRSLHRLKDKPGRACQQCGAVESQKFFRVKMGGVPLGDVCFSCAKAMLDNKPAPVATMNCPTCTAYIMAPTADLLPKAFADHVEAAEAAARPGEPHHVGDKPAPESNPLVKLARQMKLLPETNNPAPVAQDAQAMPAPVAALLALIDKQHYGRGPGTNKRASELFDAVADVKSLYVAAKTAAGRKGGAA